jgi:putative PIN family toxin of toxin-antitoxin system
MRLVLDSNVIIAAFAARGLCEALFEYCIGSREVFISEHILKEVKEKLTAKIKVPDKVASEIEIYLRESTELVVPASVNLPRLKDKDDLPLIGTAAAALSKYLITGDQELLYVKSFRKTIILSPRAFWKKMKKR